MSILIPNEAALTEWIATADAIFRDELRRPPALHLDHPDEDEVNARGYCAMCTTDDVRHTDARVWGYGNGARRPDGTVL
jgi:hypothetical protein